MVQINSRCGNVKQCLVKLGPEHLGNENERLFFCEIPDFSHPQSTNLVTTDEFFAIMLSVFVVFCSWCWFEDPREAF